MSPVSSPASLIVSVMTVDDDLRAVGCRIASMVNHGPMHLAQALATATQVYPTRSDSIVGTATLLRCEFRMRRTGAPVTDQAARDVLERLQGCQVLDAHLLDGAGCSVGHLQVIPRAS